MLTPGYYRGALAPRALARVNVMGEFVTRGGGVHYTSGWMRAWRNSPAAPLAEAFPYLILDARYERVREAGVIVSQAVLIAIGIDWDGRRQVLAVELANRESRSAVATHDL
jgi:Transposase, Mutator family